MKKQYNLTPEQEQRAAELRNMSPDAYENYAKAVDYAVCAKQALKTWCFTHDCVVITWI